MEDIIFISGYVDITVKDFMKYYAPFIKNMVDQGCSFVLGDADGVDALSQILLKKLIPVEEHSRVKVFYKGDNPQNYMSTGFVAFGGFVSHEEASVAMTLCSKEDLAHIEYGRETSVTAKNILRRFTKDFPYNKWINAKHRNVDFWNIVTAKEIENEGSRKMEVSQ